MTKAKYVDDIPKSCRDSGCYCDCQAYKELIKTASAYSFGYESGRKHQAEKDKVIIDKLKKVSE